MALAENDRFAIEDEGDGWLTLVRLGGGEISIQARELASLTDPSSGGRVRRVDKRISPPLVTRSRSPRVLGVDPARRLGSNRRRGEQSCVQGKSRDGGWWEKVAPPALGPRGNGCHPGRCAPCVRVTASPTCGHPGDSPDASKRQYQTQLHQTRNSRDNRPSHVFVAGTPASRH